MYVMSSGNESDSEPMYIEMLKYIHEGSHSPPIINMRETRYKIRDFI